MPEWCMKERLQIKSRILSDLFVCKSVVLYYLFCSIFLSDNFEKARGETKYFQESAFYRKLEFPSVIFCFSGKLLQ